MSRLRNAPWAAVKPADPFEEYLRSPVACLTERTPPTVAAGSASGQRFSSACSADENVSKKPLSAATRARASRAAAAASSASADSKPAGQRLSSAPWATPPLSKFDAYLRPPTFEELSPPTVDGANNAAERQELSKVNAEQRRRIKETGSRTDDDLTDEVAWAARAKLAAVSQERKAAELAKLKDENAAHRQMIDNTTTRTDADLTDEAAWAARETYAAMRLQRVAQNEEELAKKNQAQRELLEAVVAKTDDDITDEAVCTRASSQHDRASKQHGHARCALRHRARVLNWELASAQTSRPSLLKICAALCSRSRRYGSIEPPSLPRQSNGRQRKRRSSRERMRRSGIE